MKKNLRTMSVGAAVAVAGLALQANAAVISVDDVQSFADSPSGEDGNFEVTSNYDASGSDKLVVSVSAEDGWGAADMSVTEVTYNGIPMTKAVEGAGPSTAGVAVIFYLDNPGVAGPITISSRRPNSGVTTVYSLSNTLDGVGSTASSQNPTVNVVTGAADSLVIAHHLNGEDGNTGSAATADGPLVETGSYRHSNGWTGGGSGYQQVEVAGSVDSSFSDVGSGSGFATVAAEFQAVPEPSIAALFGLAGFALVRRCRH